MNKQILLILLPALLSATGCKQQKASEAEGTIAEAEAHQPLPPKYTARYDKSVMPARIDIERAVADSVPVNLSKVASSIEYFMVGDDKYPITAVVATNEGFIALNQPKLYLYRKGMKRKRVGLKTTYGNWMSAAESKISFDKTTTRLYAQLKRINPETGYGEPYIVELPPLDTVLTRVYYLFPVATIYCRKHPLFVICHPTNMQPSMKTKTGSTMVSQLLILKEIQSVLLSPG